MDRLPFSWEDPLARPVGGSSHSASGRHPKPISKQNDHSNRVAHHDVQRTSPKHPPISGSGLPVDVHAQPRLGVNLNLKSRLPQPPVQDVQRNFTRLSNLQDSVYSRLASASNSGSGVRNPNAPVNASVKQICPSAEPLTPTRRDTVSRMQALRQRLQTPVNNEQNHNFDLQSPRQDEGRTGSAHRERIRRLEKQFSQMLDAAPFAAAAAAQTTTSFTPTFDEQLPLPASRSNEREVLSMASPKPGYSVAVQPQIRREQKTYSYRGKPTHWRQAPAARSFSIGNAGSSASRIQTLPAPSNFKVDEVLYHDPQPEQDQDHDHDEGGLLSGQREDDFAAPDKTESCYSGAVSSVTEFDGEALLSKLQIPNGNGDVVYVETATPTENIRHQIQNLKRFQDDVRKSTVQADQEVLYQKVGSLTGQFQALRRSAAE